MLDIPVKSFSKTSRIWIYQASRLLSDEDVSFINNELMHFVDQWTAHDHALHANAWVNSKLFLCFMVDEEEVAASGCSIDKSVALVRQIGEQLNIDFFDRMTFAYKDEKEKVHLIHKSKLNAAYSNGDIDDNTLFFDTLIDKKGVFDVEFMKPLKESWHYRFIK